MALTVDEYRAELINKILFASSGQEVVALIDTAMKEVIKDNVPVFIEKIIGDLRRFNPMKKEAQQWSNIKNARILFNRLKHAATQTS